MRAKYEGQAFTDRFGPWAAIAGGSDGIGRAFAEVLAERGFDLVLIARNEAKLEDTARAIRDAHCVEVRVASIDLTGADLEKEVAQALEGLDLGLFIYNAGSGRGMGPFLESEADHWLHQMELSCRGPLLLSHQVGRTLCARGRGGLIIMSSLSSLCGSAYTTTYAASKAFDTILAEGLWQEFGPQGVDVVGCLAGSTDTETFREDTGGSDEAMDPRDVALETLAFLGRGPTFVPGAANRAGAKAMWPVPRIPLVQALSRVNATNFALPYHAQEGEEFGDLD
ncbi:MAG: SDR family NAD(P)-dependent oxidoreductase [bacterium]|nr:SDR family NAD(P)-dependent oxidoreductase [bacterium]